MLNLNKPNTMKNKIQNILLLAMLLFTEIIIAQVPDPDNLPNESNPTDVPINTYLIFLALAGIVFCYVFLNRKLSTE